MTFGTNRNAPHLPHNVHTNPCQCSTVALASNALGWVGQPCLMEVESFGAANTSPQTKMLSRYYLVTDGSKQEKNPVPQNVRALLEMARSNALPRSILDCRAMLAMASLAAIIGSCMSWNLAGSSCTSRLFKNHDVRGSLSRCGHAPVQSAMQRRLKPLGLRSLRLSDESGEEYSAPSLSTLSMSCLSKDSDQAEVSETGQLGMDLELLSELLMVVFLLLLLYCKPAPWCNRTCLPHTESCVKNRRQGR
eukprot:2703871-Rhodomonas_salina.1